ncbi:hypothetical protein ACOMHN_016140 [Nucella lapillus]
MLRGSPVDGHCSAGRSNSLDRLPRSGPSVRVSELAEQCQLSQDPLQQVSAPCRHRTKPSTPCINTGISWLCYFKLDIAAPAFGVEINI